MSELFDDEEEKALIVEDEIEESEEPEEIIKENRQRPSFDARRRLENLLDEKRLRDELKDFLDD